MAEVREIVVASAVDASADVLDWDWEVEEVLGQKKKEEKKKKINNDK